MSDPHNKLVLEINDEKRIQKEKENLNLFFCVIHMLFIRFIPMKTIVHTFVKLLSNSRHLTKIITYMVIGIFSKTTTLFVLNSLIVWGHRTSIHSTDWRRGRRCKPATYRGRWWWRRHLTS